MVGFQAKTYSKLIDGFFELSHTGMANSPQIKIFRQVFLCFLKAPVDVLVSLLPILEVKVDYSSVKEQVGAIGVQNSCLFHFLQSRNQHFGLFYFLFIF